MYKNILIFIIVLNECNLIQPIFAIYGGESANIEDYNYQVSVAYYGSHICGGSIITTKFILSSAACVFGKTLNKLQIRAGTSVSNNGGVLFNLNDVVIHPNYNSEYNDYDISIINVVGEIVFSDTINRIYLPSFDANVEPGISGFTTGWGVVEETGPLPKQLQVAGLSVLDNAYCNTIYDDEVTNNMICAGNYNSSSIFCQGDSGGAFNVDNTILGIASWSNGCGRYEYPGVYTNVINFLEFINEIIAL